jgi:chemotaxis protein methyltransferase CheR
MPQLDSFPRINIWQVGCGHGEETYTLAILLHEAGLQRKARIYTSDINPSFLQEARNGCWSLRRMEGWRESYLNSGGSGDFDSYFVEHGGEIKIKESLKQSIEFLQHNLVEEDVFKEMQFVVCRNVLIYFGEELQDRVLNLLTRSLERGGYLLLGRSENIFDQSEKHPDLDELGETYKLYRKITPKGRHV